MTYKRFYKLFNRLPLHDDEMKERLVQQYTDGRTSSLRAMTAAEYDALCDALERSTADPQHPAGAGRAGLETPRDPTQRRAESPAGTADRTGRAAPAADNLHAARRTS